MKKRFRKQNKKFNIIILVIFVISIFLFNKNDNIFLANSNYVNINYSTSKLLINKLFNKIKNDIKVSNIISNKFLFDGTKYDIYIYNSHQYEEYKSIENIDLVPTVITASYLFKNSFSKIGVNTYIEETDFEKYKKNNNLDYYASYDVSRYFIQNNVNNFKLVIDLHRDSPNNTVTTINNKKYATILFVVGKKYDYQKNYEFVEKINNKIVNYYPTLSRGISLQGTNYNQDLNSNIILLELGGVGNTIDEVSNTIDLLTPIIKEVIYEK